MKEVGTHEFEKTGDRVWSCVHCHTEVLDGFFGGIETTECIYGREIDAESDEG